MGVVLNRPLGRQLAELDPAFALGPLAGVPLYAGGPVQPKQLILASWRWLAGESAFQMHLGIDPERATELVGQSGVTLRAFLGYAGWSQGQLENELKHDTWVVSPVESDILGEHQGTALWRHILGAIDPDLKLLADEPDDPALN
jgi:putative transcriptional regulator